MTGTTSPDGPRHRTPGNRGEVEIGELPKCDFCDRAARYDGRTALGMWAYMCETHFQQYGTRLGTGRGQRLVTAGEKEPESVLQEPGRVLPEEDEYYQRR